jgi:hypothetical protein
MPRLPVRGGGAGSVPTLLSIPTISGTQTVGQTLTCSDGQWLGLKPITLTRQWIRGASTVIGSATNATYVLQAADQTNTVKCQVTASTYLGSLMIETAPTGTIP